MKICQLFPLVPCLGIEICRVRWLLRGALSIGSFKRYVRFFLMDRSSLEDGLMLLLLLSLFSLSVVTQLGLIILLQLLFWKLQIKMAQKSTKKKQGKQASVQRRNNKQTKNRVKKRRNRRRRRLQRRQWWHREWESSKHFGAGLLHIQFSILLYQPLVL